MPILNWIGKEKVINHHQEVPFKVLDQQYVFNEEQTSENKIIHGDNLEALKALLPEYEGKIKCIYIDPPYNTGNESWVYNDNVNHPKIKKWLGQVVGGTEDLTRHDKWLCMMYPRLKLLQKLLDKDGAIFISIDDNEQSNLKLICDEIFGIENFISELIWNKKNVVQNDAKFSSTNHEYILVYRKSDQLSRFNLLERSEEANARYDNPDNDPRGKWTSVALQAKSGSAANTYEIEFPNGIKWKPVEGTFPRLSKDSLLNAYEEGRLWFGKNGTNVPRLKKYLNEVQQGMVINSILFNEDVGSTQMAKEDVKKILKANVFDTPKPSGLIEKLVQLSSDKSSIILDSFSGSGTTAHAVLNLNKQDGGNRKFILIEMEDYAESITAERVKRVINGYADKEGTGGSFTYYELGQPLFIGDNSEYINEAVGIEKIRQYIWYSETRTAFTEDIAANSANEFFLGKKDTTAYYFIYQKDALTTLDYETLATINVKAESYVVYADNCLLPKEFMLQHNIVFKKIPRDITRF